MRSLDTNIATAIFGFIKHIPIVFFLECDATLRKLLPNLNF